VPNKLLTLYEYSERDQSRFINALEILPFTLAEKADLLRSIYNWLLQGIEAPTARESATGWYKKFVNFGIEGDGGSVCISRLRSLRGLHKWQGVDLDEWKPNPSTRSKHGR